MKIRIEFSAVKIYDNKTYNQRNANTAHSTTLL